VLAEEAIGLFDVKRAEKILTKKLEGVKVKLTNPTKEMKEFEKLKDFGAEVEVEESGEPSIVISNGEVEIVYKATPVQMEFEPFLRTLLRLSEGGEEGLKLEGCKGEIKVFVAPICPHCAQVVESVNRIAIANPQIKVEIIDVTLYPDLGEKYEVTSAPTIVIGEDVKLVGDHSLEELLDWIKRTLCGEDYRVEYYIMLLKDGRIDEVKEAIEKDEKNLLVLAEVLERPEIMARVGAMMILEEIFEKDPEKVKAVKEKILEILKKGDPTAIQDAAYILGKIGSKEDIPLLEELLNSENEDVREAVEEAIEEIKEREEK